MFAKVQVDHGGSIRLGCVGPTNQIRGLSTDIIYNAYFIPYKKWGYFICNWAYNPFTIRGSHPRRDQCSPPRQREPTCSVSFLGKTSHLGLFSWWFGLFSQWNTLLGDVLGIFFFLGGVRKSKIMWIHKRKGILARCLFYYVHIQYSMAPSVGVEQRNYHSCKHAFGPENATNIGHKNKTALFAAETGGSKFGTPILAPRKLVLRGTSFHCLDLAEHTVTLIYSFSVSPFPSCFRSFLPALPHTDPGWNFHRKTSGLGSSVK